MKPKTIRDFLLTIEDEKIRTEAIENAEREDPEYLDKVVNENYYDLARVLMGSFTWTKTPQGYEHWHDIHAQAQNNTLKTREIE